MILLISIFSLQNIYAQSVKTLTGSVIDDSGEGVPGANISVKGTSKGTITDFNGKYKLELPTEEVVLVFSYVGLETQEIILPAQQTVLDVNLRPDAEELDEIVVVGYGIQKKSDLSSAVSTVKAADANKIAATSPAQMLQGRTSGVSVINSGSPGSAPYIKIRGMSSFGNVQPLFVIDGIPGGDISMIPPDDIESFEILKDGAAAAIYGSLAANGVVLVTTKSGKKDQPMKIDVTMYAGIQEDMNRLNMADANQWYSIKEQTYNNSMAEGTISSLPLYLQPNSGFNLENYANTDWQDATMSSATIQNYSVGLSGGSKFSNYNLSVNYLSQDGVIDNSGTERFNFRYKSTFEKGNLKVTPNVAYSRQTWETNTMSMSNMQRSLALVPIYDETKESGYGYIDEYDIRSGANPVGQSELINNESAKDQLIANIGLQYQILDNLIASGNVGYTKSFYQQRYYYPEYKLATDTQRQNPYLQEYRAEWSDLNYDFTLTYSNTFADKHSLSVMGGIVGYEYDYANVDMNVTGGFMFPDFGGLDPSLGAAQSGDFIGTGGFQRVTRFGLMSRVNYSYDDRYLVQATIRRDASSKFGSENRWGNFPSVSAAWKLHNEEFFTGMSDVFSELKLRASYGILGRETALSAYDRQALVESGYWYVWGNKPVGGIGTPGMANSQLKWEESKTLNIGADFGLFADRVYGTINYYQNDSESLLLEDPNTPPSSGVDAPMVNLGMMSNRGLELELGYRGSIGELKYDLSANMTTLKNEVVSLGDRDGALYGDEIYGTGAAQTISMVGESASQFYMMKTNGIFQSQEQIDRYVDSEGNKIQPNAKPGDVIYVDVNGDGQIDSDDRTVVGSPLPTLEYGLNLNLSYKQFDLSLFFQGVTGNEILNVTAFNTAQPNTNFNMSADLLNAWTPENTNTDIPRNVVVDNNGNYMMSDRFLEDGSYFRLKNLQFGYTLPQSMCERLKLQKLRAYINADNVFTLTGYSGYDPEVIPSSALTQGVDYGSYPMFRTFTAGIQVSF
ncbi:SusC/RagA family TonB-linked outer membrane protein [Sediminitomix flava]|nr:TonB-dependent receptor [Sediminitomix flava]